METLRFWFEGVALWLDERRRAVAVAVGAGAGIATMVLLGSTVAAPLFTSSTSTPHTTTQAAAVAHRSDGGARGRHRHSGHRSHHHGHHGPATGSPAGQPGGHHGGGSNSHSNRHRHGSAPQGRGPFAPPAGRIFHGVSDTSVRHDFNRFHKQVGARPTVLEDFYHWDTPLTTGALQRWRSTHTRGVLSLSTAPGGGREIISPGQIANGVDDHYLLRLGESIANHHQTVYIRLFPEMNGYWNPYSAFNKDRTAKDSSHSPKSFRRAWQRAALIIRGGKRSAINRALVQRGMPRILQASSNHDPVYTAQKVRPHLDRPKVGFVWTPLAISSPNVPGNQPSDYWPGRAFVDWVGTDLYAKYDSASMRSAVNRLYRDHPGLPFAVGEYSPWNKDPRGNYTRHLFHWAESHHRVGMLIYYRSVTTRTHFAVGHWDAARRVIRHQLNKRQFAR
jgi:hypothetical protein